MDAAPPPSPPRAAAGSLRRIGRDGLPVLVIDGVHGDPEAVVGIAAALAPFPPASGVAYPGLRRYITAGDAAAAAYVRRLLGRVAGAINRAFGIDGFDLIEASFSLVTAPPATLSPEQRVPHFDSPDPLHLAVLHYLSATPGTGTAFFRQRGTGIERVTTANLAAFVAAARPEAAASSGYVQGTTTAFEQIDAVEAVPDRLVIYQGSLLHSGLIPPDMAFSDDPRVGRLTTNLFVTGRRPVVPAAQAAERG